MTKNSIVTGIVLVIATTIALVAFVRVRPREVSVSPRYDEFAQCLADKGYIMYGAYWCPHCKNEKKGFGPSAWKRVTYVECTQEPRRCTEAGISGYPTWIAPGGVRLEGEQGVERLSHASGCSLFGTIPFSPEGSEVGTSPPL